MKIRIAFLAGLSLAVLIVLFLFPPIPQPQHYHAFADQRGLFGVPNAFNVLTNLAFLAIGTAGFILLKKVPPGERRPWSVLFAAEILTSFGSAYYHWTPNDSSLFADRLPLAVIVTSLLGILIIERVNERAGKILFVPLTVLGAGSVLLWHYGSGDLRLYLFAHYYSLVAILLILFLFPSRYTRTKDWVLALGLYGAAKGCEFLDAEIYSLGHVISGHSLKHLLAAGSLAMILGSVGRDSESRSDGERRYRQVG